MAMIFEPALEPAQSFFDMLYGLIKGDMRIIGASRYAYAYAS